MKNMKILRKLFTYLVIFSFITSPFIGLIPINNNSPKRASLLADNPSFNKKTIPEISDNFDQYVNTTDLGNTWIIRTQSGTSVELSSDVSRSPTQVVKFVDNTLTERANITQIFADQYDYLYFSCYIYPTEVDEAFAIYTTNNSEFSGRGADCGLYPTGQAFYASGAAMHFGLTYSAGTWIHFEVLHDIQSRSFSVYVNDEVLCENVPTIHPVTVVDRVIIATSGGFGAGSAVFYVDDVTVRGRLIESKRNISSTIDEDFESYLNNTEVAANWDLICGTNSTDVNVTLQYDPAFSHSNSQSIRIYDNNIISEWARLSYNFSSNPLQDVYLRSYVMPAQIGGILTIAMRNVTDGAYGNIFSLWDDGMFHYRSSGVRLPTGVSFAANQWYKIEMFAKMINQTYSVRVNDSWIVQDVPFGNPVTEFVQLTFDSAGGALGVPGETYYIDDVFIANETDEVIYGTPMNSFNEKLLLDADANRHTLLSEDVTGTETVAMEYQYNYSEYAPGTINQFLMDYAYDSSANKTSADSQIVVSDFSSWTLSDTIQRTTGLMLNVEQLDSLVIPTSGSKGLGSVEAGSWASTQVLADANYWMIFTNNDWVISWLRLNIPNPNSARRYKQLTHYYHLRFASQYNAPGYLSTTDPGGHPVESGGIFTRFKVEIPRDNAWHFGGYAVPHTPNYDNEYLGELYPSSVRHIAWRYQQDWFDDTWLSSDYQGVWYYWDEYKPSGTATETFTLSTTGYKQVHNITDSVNIPGGCSLSLEYNANTPYGWTGWQTTTSGATLNVLASEIEVRYTLTPEATLEQLTPRVNSMTINYGDAPTINTSVSLYDTVGGDWDLFLNTTGLGVQAVQAFMATGGAKYFDANGIMRVLVEANADTPQWLFYLDQLAFNLTEPVFELKVEEHTEDDVIVTENNTFVSNGTPYVISYFDINLSIRAKTVVNQDFITWTNVSVYYKIGSGSWQGPHPIGYGYDAVSGSFLIDEKNYTTNDDLYYYFHFEQSDGVSTQLAEHYWCQNGTASDESEARNMAFHKNIHSILYGLTLNYSVWYSAEREIIMESATGGNRTFYPWRRITYDNFSLSFVNTTVTQNNFSVSCPTEPKLDHYVEEYKRNISTSDEPYFHVNNAIKSPFALSLDRTYQVWSTNLTIPLVAFNAFTPDRNLTFPATITTVTYKGVKNFLYPNLNVHLFSNDNVTLRFDVNTGIMVYFEYVWGPINASNKIVFALIDNQQLYFNSTSYTVNLLIDSRYETIEEGIQIIADYPLLILYDPPGDHSYTQLSYGTTISYGMGLEVSTGVTTFMETDNKFFGVGGGFEQSTSVTTGVGFDVEVEISYQTLLTSSLESENASLIGPGRGDLYYLVGLLIPWTIKQWNFYIVNGTPDAPDYHLDDLKVWENGSRIEYGLNISSDVEVLGAYLDTYGLSHVRNYNIFEDNTLGPIEEFFVNEIPGSPLTWTPQSITEKYISFSTTKTLSFSLTMEMEMTTFASWEQDVSTPSVPFVCDSQTIFETTGKVGVSFEFSLGVTGSTSTTENREIMIHLEDDDGTPVGEHDQFVIEIYQDLRYLTFGCIVYENFTFTSRPFEFNTRDRRSPDISELFGLDQYLQGTEILNCATLDGETGVDHVKIYYDNDPVFDLDSTYVSYSDTPIPLNPNIYQVAFDTSALHGTYYVWVVTFDNAWPVMNQRLSVPYPVLIDNINPDSCQARAYGPYREDIRLYANCFDADSGIEYVEYWDGDPDTPGSTFIGVSYDSSSSFQYVWATDPNGADDGVRLICARSFDKAGNHLDSTLLEITVDNVSPPPDPNGLTNGMLIALLVIGSVGIGAYLLNTTVLKKRVQPTPPPKKGKLWTEKPPKGA